MKHQLSSLVLVFILVVCMNVGVKVVVGMPLSTNSRWIVDENGHRVKLACVNWPSHLEAVLAEGLDKKSVDYIAYYISRSMSLNCVRFTWPVALATDESLASTTVRNHFQSLGLVESIAGIQTNNPDFLDLTLIQAYQTVVKKLGIHNVMVILDNHLSKPGWCCGEDDGNGFFGDQYFDPELWLKGLSTMATIFKDTKNVVGMSLRNELRGPNQNVDVWTRYMQQGAETVHQANPNVLVILSGLSYDLNLDFLKENPVKLSFTGKLVFEVHQYSFSIGDGWVTGNPNEVCNNVVGSFHNNAGFLLEQGFPLFLSEFGGDQSGNNVGDNRFLNCMFGFIADLDIDWAVWGLQGSYYLREGVKDSDEIYGMLDRDWNTRNHSYGVRLSSIQNPFQGPGELNYHDVIYHPSTGYCLKLQSGDLSLQLDSCKEATAWRYDAADHRIKMATMNKCLQAQDEVGRELNLVDCNEYSTTWDMISASNLHLSTKLPNGEIVCMDVNPANRIVQTNPCICLDSDPNCDPSNQWFKIIKST